MSTEVEQTMVHGEDPRFLERVSSLPIVTTAIDQLAQIYEYTKGSHHLVKYTLETAEAGVRTVTQSALPVVNKLEKPISAIDSIACSQLDKLEQTYPIVTKSTEEVVEESRKVYECTVKPHVDTVTGATQSAVDKVGAAKQYTVDTVSAVKDYGATKVQDVKTYTYEKAASTATYGKDKLDEILETPGGQAVISRVDQALNVTDQYVDYYLPGDKKGEEGMEVEKECDESSLEGRRSDQTFSKLTGVSDKVRRRMYAKTLRELQHIKTRSQETIQRLNFTVDLIDYAKNNLDGAKTKASSVRERFMEVWDEINKEEEGVKEEEEETAEEERKTLERRAIVTARHLTSQLRRGFSTMMSTVTVLPSSLQTRLNDAKQFSDKLYTNFTNAKTLEDIPSSLVTQTRTHVTNLQETILTYTDYFRNSYFGSWLGAKAVAEIEEGSEKGEEEEGEEMEDREGKVEKEMQVEEEEEKMEEEPSQRRESHHD